MSDKKDKKHVGDIRASQILTTYGPGSLIDFPYDAAIMGGINHWPKGDARREVREPRLRNKLATMLGIHNLRLVAPPADDSPPWERGPRVKAFRFPNWFLADVEPDEGDKGDVRTRRLVPRNLLEGNQRFEGRPTVPVRFVTACPKGHIADVDWRYVLPCDKKTCDGKPIYLDEHGAGGDLSDLVLRCQCGAQRVMADLADMTQQVLGRCSGKRPWLRGWHEECDQPARLLIRTASNAYFAQTVTLLSLPETKNKLAAAVDQHWSIVKSIEELAEVKFSRKWDGWKEAIEAYTDEQVLEAVEAQRKGGASAVPVKEAELESILAAPVGYMTDLPTDKEFLARKLPDSIWRTSGEWPQVECVVQLHRLREVTALTGFTRFEATTPDIHGDYEGDVQVAAIDPEPRDFPAIENRGEGIFLQLSSKAVDSWAKNKAVQSRAQALSRGHERWSEDRKGAAEFPGVEYILLHTLSHMLLQSIAMTCGYPATSIRERVYKEKGSYGILLYTASPDAEGTLGGLVSEARHMGKHLERALREGALCSNDPICAQHDAGQSLEARWLHGAACHGCSLIAETSCEMRNEFLDRALVVPVLSESQSAFFSDIP